MTLHNHTLSTNMSQRTRRKRPDLREKHVACNNGRPRITTNEKNKDSNHEKGHETGSATQVFFKCFGFQGAACFDPEPALRSRLWNGRMRLTLCRRAPRSQPPLCRSHDDGTCAAKTSPWQLKAYLAEEAKQVRTNLSVCETKKTYK